METSILPRHQRLHAQSQNLKEIDYDKHFNVNSLKGRRVAFFHPKVTDDGKTPKFMFAHDFNSDLPRMSTVDDREKSVILFNLLKCMSNCTSAGSKFIKQQCPYIANWNDMSREEIAKWGMRFRLQENGTACDRAIYIYERVGFVACAWDDRDYTWMQVQDGHVITVADERWMNDEIRVMGAM